ncbi:cleavage and polyadenylation specificity factor subunit 4-like [Limulus polyphemus]|uniref:Cleavage and polyadenylation specificity factor subunit 4 n=1 Tax=Limulus polyphemus TaxID=6850 RepID=A0ABM1S251_LIMPO|nr:cleavage and polyadenylation specificity factor subunit 4-like [Limulus polyphemus]XP_022237705.1 cleavage and polyadenylation specificity factor subunit 4-like [Limulus polyphemus]XP_022237706.1 cleavage and polyadenylation specificity factor subunit 4-like [Limulus polyphemus]XP_022237707.1 cleavage and polyadenylation specificity factor subunit 4-like [Limulus polyphemus]XP_022237708.1 cleavage and polyadenylation specificity factor subunit 4-like [Limulus polyphemus]XP_022237709.1 cleav
MEEIVADVDGIRFDIENALEQQLGALPLPFPGMDKSGAAVCEYFTRGLCSKAGACPFRHVRGDRTVVCKHWLRGLCKKGDQCEFLHEFDMTKMPECYFYSRFNACSNKECPFLHIDPEAKIKDCPWYDRGFCRHGPNCRHRHTRRVICINYLCGFCPEGSNCKYMHPKFDLPMQDSTQQGKKQSIVCHYCGETGHKAVACLKMPPELKEEHRHNHIQIIQNIKAQSDLQMQEGQKAFRPLDQVTCFKCGEKGHYANKCPKGHLAFLSSALQSTQQSEDN